MTNTITYPEREYLEPVNNFYDVMQYELSIHPNGPELRKGIETLSKMYNGYSLSNSLKQYSTLMGISQKQMGSLRYEYDIDFDFYSGSVLATHCILRSQSARQRGILLRKDLISDYIPVTTCDDEILYDPERMIDNLILWSRGDYLHSLGKESDEFQELVITAATRAYDDTDHNPAIEGSFISGFMMAKDLLVMEIIKVKDTPHEKRYIFPGPPV